MLQIALSKTIQVRSFWFFPMECLNFGVAVIPSTLNSKSVNFSVL
jgi:hypothetical protein